MQEEMRAAETPTKNAEDLKASLMTQATEWADLLDKSIQMDGVSQIEEEEEMYDFDGDGIPDVWIEVTEMGHEEDEFAFEPRDGDKLEFFNNIRKYK